MEHLQRVWHASTERLPFRTPGSVPLLGTCLCSTIVETSFTKFAVSFLNFSPSILLGTFWILLHTPMRIFVVKTDILEYK